jgi:hypothetical protein
MRLGDGRSSPEDWNLHPMREEGMNPEAKVSDQEFRRQVTTAYRRLIRAARAASEAVIRRDSKAKQAIAWRLVDDVRGELLDVIGELMAKKKGE